MNNSPLTPDHKEKQLKLLTQLVNSTLSSDWNESNRKIFFFIKRSLHQFKLDSQLQESDILVDAYLRVRKKIESGESIRNMPAYLNRIAHNIIREKSKNKKKSEFLHTRLINNGYGNIDVTLVENNTDSDKLTILLKAMEQLSPRDRELIQKRIVQGLSWQEISEILSDSEDKKNGRNIPKSTLRKRGQRALNRLRKAYNSVSNL